MNQLQRGTVFVLGGKQSDEIVKSFVNHCHENDIDDDDTVHLFQCREDCTDENYRPPELSLVQISKLQLHTITFKKNGIFYTFSADILDIYGKGLTSETSFENLQSQVCNSVVDIRRDWDTLFPCCSTLDGF